MVKSLLENKRAINRVENLIEKKIYSYYPELASSGIRVKHNRFIKRLITSDIYQFDIYSNNAVFKTIFVKKRKFGQLYNNDIIKDTIAEFENLSFFSSLPDRKFSTPRVLDVISQEGILVTEKIEGKSLYSFLKKFSYLPLAKVKELILRDICIKTGEWLREFHKAGLTGECGKIDTKNYIEKAKLIVNNFPHYGLTKILGNSLIEKIKNLEGSALDYTFPVSFKHGDFQPMNIFYSGDKVSVIDIDLRNKDITIKDVTNFVTGLYTFNVNCLASSLNSHILNGLIDDFLNSYFDGKSVPYRAIEFVKILGILESLERTYKRNESFLKRKIISTFYNSKLKKILEGLSL